MKVTSQCNKAGFGTPITRTQQVDENKGKKIKNRKFLHFLFLEKHYVTVLLFKEQKKSFEVQYENMEELFIKKHGYIFNCIFLCIYILHIFHFFVQSKKQINTNIHNFMDQSWLRSIICIYIKLLSLFCLDFWSKLRNPSDRFI